MSGNAIDKIDELDQFKKVESVLVKVNPKISFFLLDLASFIKKLFLNTNRRADVDYSGYIKKGDAFAKTKDYYGAIEYYNKAISIHLSGYYAHYKRGLAKIKLQDYLDAVEDFDLAIKFSPKAFIPDKWINSDDFKKQPGVFYFDELGTACRLLTPQINASAYFWKGFANSMLEYYQDAILHYNMALELIENNKEAYYNRGLAKHEMGDIKGARLDFKRAYALGVSKANEMIDKYC